MIDRDHELPVSKQCAALGISQGISRGSVYYEPSGVSQSDLALMRRIDELHLAHPHAGSRMLRDLLAAEGSKIGRRHVRTLMERMGIEAVYCRPRTSAPAPGHKIYPYLLRGLTIEPGVGVGHNVHPDGVRIRLSCCCHGLVRASYSGLATVDHARCGLLHRGARGGFAPLWQAGDLQLRSRQPVHKRSVYGRSDHA